MDGVFTPAYLFDLLRDRAASGRRRWPKPRRQKTMRCNPFLPLVEEDGLFFHPPVQTTGAGAAPAPGADSPEVPGAEVAQTFRSTFSQVWHRIPAEDRHGLLDYWRTDPFPAMFNDIYPPRPRPRPLIYLVDRSQSEEVVDRFGHVLLFPWSLAAEAPPRLADVIARALAQVHRFVTRAHWALTLSKLEEPMGRWERRRPDATDADYDAQWDKLLRAYLRLYEAELAQILSRWGFAKEQTEDRIARKR